MQHFPDGINPFVVAEIGCNHQGNVDVALDMVEAAANCGASAVKFQKRDNKALFRSCLFNSEYDNPNSYGFTYGEHRNRLELNHDDFLRIIKCAHHNNISIQITPFDFPSLKFCQQLPFDAYKIASADIVFPQLIHLVCETTKPVFVSSGGCSEKEILDAAQLINSYHSQCAFYHCTAAYPAPIKDMNLSYISRLGELLPEGFVVGLSDHENGIDAAVVAYMLGARVFEKHFTLDRSWKGTDQSFSLEPTGLKKLVRNLKRIDELLGEGSKQIFDSEKKPLSKMIKSLVFSRDVPAGTPVDESMISFKVCKNPGFKPYMMNSLVGSVLTNDVYEDQIVSQEVFE